MVMKRMTCSYELLPLWAFRQTFPSEVTNAPSERSPTEFRNTIPWCRIHCASVHGAIRAAVCCATPGSQKSGFGVLSSHILVTLAFFPVRSRDAGWKLESRVQMLQPIAKKKIKKYHTMKQNFVSDHTANYRAGYSYRQAPSLDWTNFANSSAKRSPLVCLLGWFLSAGGYLFLFHALFASPLVSPATTRLACIDNL